MCRWARAADWCRLRLVFGSCSGSFCWGVRSRVFGRCDFCTSQRERGDRYIWEWENSCKLIEILKFFWSSIKIHEKSPQNSKKFPWTHFTAWMTKMMRNRRLFPITLFDVISSKTSTFSNTLRKSFTFSSVGLLEFGSSFVNWFRMIWSLKRTNKLDSEKSPSVTIELSVSLPEIFLSKKR